MKFEREENAGHEGTRILDVNLIPYSHDMVSAILLECDRPLMETELLKRLDNDRDAHESLFVRHFSLYHVLYRLAEEWGRRGYYLHRDCMRIRLLPLPVDGCCHYFPEEGRFCGMQRLSRSWCSFHEYMYNPVWDSITHDPLRDFYLNEENISFGSTGLFEKIQSGIMVYAFRRGEVRKALELFGLVKPDRKLVERRYRELAMLHHPDMGGDGIYMASINHAYGVLKEVYVL